MSITKNTILLLLIIAVNTILILYYVNILPMSMLNYMKNGVKSYFENSNSETISNNYINNNSNNNSQNLFDKIKISNIFDIHIDTNKSATYYIINNNLIITMLFKTAKISQIRSNNIKLLIELENEVILNQNVNVFQYLIHKNAFYATYYISLNLVESNNNINSKSKLTYQFNVNDNKSDKFMVKIVDNRNKETNKLTARLIKCFYIENEQNEDFNYILSLIIKSNYDSIYICIFSKDNEIKQRIIDISRKFNKKIQIFELDNFPNSLGDSNDDFKLFKDVDKYPQIGKTWDFYDTPLEFLLNLKYPSLIEKYKYVHAADFDHILFPQNKSMYDFIEDINTKNNIKSHVSLYFNQYWALTNILSKQIFQNLNSIHNFPTIIKTEKFDISIDNKIDLEYANKIANDVANLNSSDKFRKFIIMLSRDGIYGQTVHNTKASIIIKLCQAGLYFPGGTEKTISSAHMIHYRDSFNFDLIKKFNRISIRSFVTWFDLHFDYSQTYEKYQINEQKPY
jgi:hypothetical protein